VTDQAAGKLYSPAMLGLAVELADYPLRESLPYRAEARSRTCGSVISLGLALDDAGHVTTIGMQVSACAIGQASAALLARAAAGRDARLLADTGTGIAQWLAGLDDLPDWPGLATLIPARVHPGRHGALLLPWTAASMALSSRAANG
jgi:NifU-like protein involved in Fe-S cluster formation